MPPFTDETLLGTDTESPCKDHVLEPAVVPPARRPGSQSAVVSHLESTVSGKSVSSQVTNGCVAEHVRETSACRTEEDGQEAPAYMTAGV